MYFPAGVRISQDTVSTLIAPMQTLARCISLCVRMGSWNNSAKGSGDFYYFFVNWGEAGRCKHSEKGEKTLSSDPSNSNNIVY